MRRIRKKILATLLIAFSFFVVHDLLLQSLVAEERGLSSSQTHFMHHAKQDAGLSLHELIHLSMIAVDVAAAPFEAFGRTACNFDTESPSGSSVAYSLERPPLA